MIKSEGQRQNCSSLNLLVWWEKCTHQEIFILVNQYYFIYIYNFILEFSMFFYNLSLVNNINKQRNWGTHLLCFKIYKPFTGISFIAMLQETQTDITFHNTIQWNDYGEILWYMNIAFLWTCDKTTQTKAWSTWFPVAFIVLFKSIKGFVHAGVHTHTSSTRKGIICGPK